jgi:hypothetical protein
MDLKKTLTSTFQSLTGKVVDGKHLQYWEQAISNNAATIDSFIAHIVTQDDYVDFAEGVFGNVFNDIIRDHKYNIKEFFDLFWKVNRGKEIKPEVCRQFICSLPFFETYIANMINDIFNFEFGRVASTEEIRFYADKVIETSGFKIEHYSLQDLMKDIPKNLFDNSRGPPFRGQLDVEPTQHLTDQHYDIESVDNFEDVFNRPMFIQEYFKYVIEKNTLDLGIEDLHVTHNFKYNKLRSIFQSYTGKSISEYYFVKKYLYKVDDPTFYDNNIDEIVNSIEYKQGMQKVLADKYQKMFDLSLYGSDIDYIFNIVKTKKLDIITEEIDLVLEQLKAETDEIISNIFKVYMDVLQRAPDMSEIERYVSFYRERKDTQTNATTNAELERIIVRTLEFHDIIKKHIRSIYLENKEKEILHSSMYDILNRIISRIDEVNMKTLIDIVKSLI